MGASGLYSINDNDLYDSYGWVPAPGASDDFLKFYKSKPPITTKDWPDQNGIEVDLTSRRFAEKEIKMSGALVADNEADFWDKHLRLFTLFNDSELLRMYVNEFRRSFYVYYQDCTQFERLTRILDNGQEKVACLYTFTFIEPVPGFWRPVTLLVDENRDFYRTPEGWNIIISA